MKLSAYYKKFFNSLYLPREDLIHLLLLVLYILVLIGFFAFTGPIGDVLLGFPIALSATLAFLGTPLLAVLLWPAYTWAVDKVHHFHDEDDHGF
jgi:hypothetical protein